MNEHEILAMARELGFDAAMIDAEDVPVNHAYRACCEENLCGQYDGNYSCPPTCGTPQEMEDRIRENDRAVVVISRWDIADYQDRDTISKAKTAHNKKELTLARELRHRGLPGVMVGGGCCNLCSPCAMVSGKPCHYPEERFSCMSAYCVDVAALAKKCGLDFQWTPGKLFLCGMYAYKVK